MNKYLISLFALLVLGAGVILMSQENPSEQTTSPQSSMTVDQEPNSEDTKTNLNSKELLEFSAEALKNSEAEHKVVFFHADWCSVCNSVERNINADTIPGNMDIFKLDFESDQGRELAEKYQIPIQYTSVLVDKNGNEIKQWVNLPNFGPQEFLDKIEES